MHLNEITEIFKAAKDQLVFKSNKLSGISSTRNYALNNLIDLRRGLLMISEVDFLKPVINLLKDSTNLFDSLDDQDYFSEAENDSITSIVEYLNNTIVSFLAYQESLTNYGENALKIKLPEFDDFEELSKISNDLKLSISIPVSDSNTDGNLKVITAEPGSIWLTVTLGSVAAVKLIGAICWAAAVIRRKIADAKIHEAHTRTLELKNELIEAFVDAQKTQLKNIAEAEAEAIANKYYDIKDPEVISRLKLSINTVADLIDRGAKFIPESKEAEIKKQFPDYSSLNLIESTIKQITDSN